MRPMPIRAADFTEKPTRLHTLTIVLFIFQQLFIEQFGQRYQRLIDNLKRSQTSYSAYL